ncbi:hypothetical protein M5K25_021403 [Dendrobium thyrsiflorum]|uniref:RING-type domain-containing protein n=1 Tax=Dendrobium thyrsiflorum TaxID=117978 RepID=A0ABD0UJA7_DENTH
MGLNLLWCQVFLQSLWTSSHMDKILRLSLWPGYHGNSLSTMQRCAICLSEYQEKDILRVLPYCGHAFHVYCIDTWLRQHWTCPVCRISLRNSPDRRRKTPPAQNSSLRPLFRENFASESYHYQFGVDNFSSRLIPDPARADDTVSSNPEVNCSTEIVKRMESPSNS